MTTTGILARSIAQALTRSKLTRSESRFTDEITAYEGDALQDQLALLGLPVLGDRHPTGANLYVSNISATRDPGTLLTRLTWLYEPPEYAGQPADPTQLVAGVDVAFSAVPELAPVTVPRLESYAVRTETQETDGDGNPTGQTIGTNSFAWESADETLETPTIRVNYSVNGLESSLGLSNAIGFGTIESVMLESNTVHVIGGLALLFRGIDIRWTQTQNGERSYQIDYEWLYDSGVENTPSSLPAGWEENPLIGSVSIPLFAEIQNSRGFSPEDSNGDRLFVTALPNIQPPPGLSGVGHIGSGTTRYTHVPYCESRIVRDVASPENPVPAYQAVPRYSRVDADAWQTFPGIGG